MEEFDVKQGLRQGCPLFLWLFSVSLDRVVHEGGYGGVQGESGTGVI